LKKGEAESLTYPHARRASNENIDLHITQFFPRFGKSLLQGLHCFGVVTAIRGEEQIPAPVQDHRLGGRGTDINSQSKIEHDFTPAINERTFVFIFTQN
jgi:hypothetical protein